MLRGFTTRFGSRLARIILSLALLGVAPGACQPAPRAATARTVEPRSSEIFWTEGVKLPTRERIEAEVSVFGVRAGAFNMELSRACTESSVETLELRSEMSTVGVVRWLKASDGSSFTTMEAKGARPLRSELTLLNGATTRTFRAVLSPGGSDTTIETTGDPTRRLHEATPRGEHPLDMPSAFVLLRHWQAAPGTQGYFYVLLGRHLWRVDVRSLGEVTMAEQYGGRTALEIVGRAERVVFDDAASPEARRFAMWLSPDEARVPLRVEGDASFGKVSFVLTAHETDGDEHAPVEAGRCLPAHGAVQARAN